MESQPSMEIEALTGTPTTGTTTTGTTTTPTTPPFDCDIPLPVMPGLVHTYTGYSTAEDFDFDGYGYAVALHNGNLTGKDQTGDVKVISPNVASETAGSRILATGDFAVATWNGTVVLVDGVTGGKTTLISNMSYPNGVEVDIHDNVYVADQNEGKIVRINAYNTNDFEEIATGLSNPNGVILTEDEQTLYVGSFGGGVVYAIDRNPAGGWFEERILFSSPGPDNGYDGINVDICGNVYFTEWIVGKVRRITPDGLQVDEVATLPSYWIPNLRWGNDVGGWANDRLYVSDRESGRIFELDVGIPGKTPLVP